MTAAPHPASVAALAQRWLEWQPWVRAWLQSLGDSTSRAYATMREEHRRRLTLALACNLEMRVIRRNRVDDPRLSADDFTLRLARVLRRRNGPRASAINLTKENSLAHIS